MLKFVVPPTFAPLPVKVCLRKLGVSQTLLRKIKTSGSICINKEPAANHTLVFPGDVIELTWQEECHIPPTAIPLTICYEDDYLLVVDKPAGMLVHPTVGNEINTLANAVIHYYQQQGTCYGFHPIHRLDKNTSGLILIAKVPHIQHVLMQGNTKSLYRIYHAIIEGIPQPLTGFIEAPIGRKPDSIIERTVRPDGQYAATYYRVLASYRRASLVQLKLLTGRTHQIRVHMAYIGHPLLGDDLYHGSTALFSRQALHAARISFDHPVTHKRIDVFSTLPADMLALIAALQQN